MITQIQDGIDMANPSSVIRQRRTDAPPVPEPPPEPVTIVVGEAIPRPVVSQGYRPPVPVPVATAISQRDPALLLTDEAPWARPQYVMDAERLPDGLACRVGPGRINPHVMTAELALSVADLVPIGTATEAAADRVREIVRQVEAAITATDEAAAYRDAVAALDAGKGELADAAAKVADLHAKHDAAVHAGKNPAAYAGKIAVADAELQATKGWVEGLSRKVLRASADLGRVRSKFTQDLARAELRDLASKKAELQARAEAFLRGFAVEVLNAEAMQRAVEVLTR